jgi:membrane protease YdiL (CAAX protease family)
MQADETSPTPDRVPSEPPPLLSAPPPLPRPWGFWKVLGGTVLALLTGEIVALLLHAAYLLIVVQPAGGLSREDLTGDHSFGPAGWIGAAVTIALCWQMAGRTCRGTPRAVLGLQAVPGRTVLAWCGVALLLCALNDGLLILLDRPVVHESMIEIYQATGTKLLLLLVVNVQAPVMEELIMRGFFLEGLRHTKVGLKGAVLLSAFVWAILHVQYDLYGIGSIFVLGIVYGFVRIRTGSILPVIAMHALNNVWSTVELLVVVNRG